MRLKIKVIKITSTLIKINFSTHKNILNTYFKEIRYHKNNYYCLLKVVAYIKNLAMFHATKMFYFPYRVIF